MPFIFELKCVHIDTQIHHGTIIGHSLTNKTTNEQLSISKKIYLVREEKEDIIKIKRTKKEKKNT